MVLIQIPCKLSQAVLTAVNNYSALRIVSDYEECSAVLLARYLMTTSKCVAYPVEGAPAVIVAGTISKALLDSIPAKIGLSVQKMTAGESAAIGLSIHQMVVFMAYHHLLSAGLYQAFADGLAVISKESDCARSMVDGIIPRNCVINSNGEGFIELEYLSYRKVNLLGAVADDIFQDDEDQEDVGVQSSKPKQALWLSTGEDVVIQEEFVLMPSRPSRSLTSHWDDISRQQGYRGYVPATAESFALYWQLAHGITLDSSCWALARVTSTVDERIVPIEVLCKMCVESAGATAAGVSKVAASLPALLRGCKHFAHVGESLVIGEQQDGKKEDAKAAPTLVKASALISVIFS